MIGKKVLGCIMIALTLVFGGVSVAMAGGTETLGPPLGVTLASGTGILAAGTGLADGTGNGTISFTVPAGATVKQVLIYWEGQTPFAAEKLAEIGISAEVIDPRTTFPLDKETIIESVKRTSRAIVLDEGYERYGVTAEIASVITDGAFYYLDAPVKRMGAMDVPVPFSPSLEECTVPTPDAVFEMAKTLCRKN